jgi:glycerophosphoryl diester phosphodiesterase
VSHRTVQVHGHRGARAVLPENTLEGFRYAIDAGADFIELDVLATADQTLVVCHDPVLRRPIYRRPAGCTRVVRRMTAEELRAWDCGSRPSRLFRRQQAVPGARIPTLDEVLALAPRGRFGFNIEIKSSGLRPSLTSPPELAAELVVRAIHRRHLQRRVLVQSFDPRVLEYVRGLDASLRLSRLCGLRGRSFAQTALRSGVTIVGPYHRLVTRRRVEAAHSAGVQVIPWTANRPRDWERLIQAGVDGIITDDPAGLVAYLALR